MTVERAAVVAHGALHALLQAHLPAEERSRAIELSRLAADAWLAATTATLEVGEAVAGALHRTFDPAETMEANCQRALKALGFTSVEDVRRWGEEHYVHRERFHALFPTVPLGGADAGAGDSARIAD